MNNRKKHNFISLIAAAVVFALVSVSRGGEPAAGAALDQLRGYPGMAAPASRSTRPARTGADSRLGLRPLNPTRMERCERAG